MIHLNVFYMWHYPLTMRKKLPIFNVLGVKMQSFCSSHTLLIIIFATTFETAEIEMMKNDSLLDT